MYRRIRDLREDSDLTQKSLADYLSCSQVCYSNYETGKRDVPSDVLIRLARFYHTSVDYLVLCYSLHFIAYYFCKMQN